VTPRARADAALWLRKFHGWIGLWGATLGLLFGFSGIWLNHRAVLPLQPAVDRSSSQLPLPDPRPADPRAMAAWLQSALALPRPAGNVRVEPARPAPWAEKAAGHPPQGRGDADRARARERAVDAPAVASAPGDAAASSPAVAMQPEHWTFSFNAPRSQIQAEYWAGNHSVSVRRSDNGIVATLTNLHKGVGMPVAWILLVDTLAGSLILLSLSGLALWMLTRRRRTLGVAIFGTALVVAAGLAIAHL